MSFTMASAFAITYILTVPLASSERQHHDWCPIQSRLSVCLPFITYLGIEFAFWADPNDVKQEKGKPLRQVYSCMLYMAKVPREKSQADMDSHQDPIRFTKCRPSKVPRFNSINTGASLAKIHRDPAQGEQSGGSQSITPE
ncbi:hypothetical protein GGI35DRAFT_430475 [Trichoderma velutinum]